MSKKVQIKNRPTTAPTGLNPLATVPFEKGFHFYTAIGSYTGVTATNLKEFAAKLQIVPTESITFHFQRKDFQQWMKDTVKNAALANQVNSIQQGLCPEDLKKEILNTVNAYAV
jgi:alpha-amylase